MAPWEHAKGSNDAIRSNNLHTQRSNCASTIQGSVLSLSENPKFAKSQARSAPRYPSSSRFLTSINELRLPVPRLFMQSRKIGRGLIAQNRFLQERMKAVESRVPQIKSAARSAAPLGGNCGLFVFRNCVVIALASNLPKCCW